jgi:predicted HAD superfamily Cof-like phosphohydrolase
MPTPHFRRIRAFMQKANQATPPEVVVPEAEIRVLRAKLILEEALETVEALGITVQAGGEQGPVIREKTLHYTDGNPVDIEGVVDGCADISVVTIGTLIAFGVDDEPVLEEVDSANLRKFGPGGHRREDGKWIKPPDWTPPDIGGAIGRGNPKA